MSEKNWLEDEHLYGENIEISRMEYKGLMRINTLYGRLNADLKEYMGFPGEFLASDKFLLRYNKKELLEKIHQQRCVIQKLIKELDPAKRDDYLRFLQELFEKA